ncbi:hypothetical protein RYX36_021706 [Vicia faba]
MEAISEIKKSEIHVAVFSTDPKVMTDIENLAKEFNHEVSFFSYIPSNHMEFLEFQFIIMDGFMAEIDRYEFVKSVTKEANLPVVVLCNTAAKDHELRNINAQKNGAVSHWSLPVGPDDYMQIESILKERASVSDIIRRRKTCITEEELCKRDEDRKKRVKTDSPSPGEHIIKGELGRKDTSVTYVKTP